MSRIKLSEVLIVEGKYDATALASLVDALIITTNGFSIFSDAEKKALIQKLGRQRGLVILTDSDAAGFRIRHYIEKIAKGSSIKNAYIPAIAGKESRKDTPSKEGTLGVEGLPPQVLLAALERAGVVPAAPAASEAITYADLYEWGISGGSGSAGRRRALLAKLDLPPRLSKRALCQVLSSLYTKQHILAQLSALPGAAAPLDEPAQKPVLFWDFHGTLTLPDITWFDAAMEAAAEQAPDVPLSLEKLARFFTGTCLPWFTVASKDTRHIAGSSSWWAYCEAGFVAMLQNCGFSQAQAQKIAPTIRSKVLQPHRYQLYPDAISTLQALKSRGYESHILSNNYPELPQVVAELGLSPHLGSIITSGLVGYEKPHPQIFAHARALAPGAPLWMIGDNPTDDICGGKAAGFTTVAVHGAAAPEADHHTENLSGILHLLP